MRLNNPLVSLVHLFCVAVILGFGAFCCLLAKFEPLKRKMFNMLSQGDQAFVVFGGAVLLVGIVFTLALTFMHRKQYLELNVSGVKYGIDPRLIESSLRQHLHSMSCDLVSVEVAVRSKKKLMVLLELANLDKKSAKTVRKNVLEHVKGLGYTARFSLSLVA